MSIFRGVGRAISSGGRSVTASRGARFVGSKIANATAKSGSLLANIGESRAAMVGVGTLAFGIGAMQTAAPAARDALLEAGTGDENADVAFTGRKFSARYLTGTAIGGPVGGAMRLTAPEDFFAQSAPVLEDTTKNSFIGGAAIGAASGIAATGAGYNIGKKIATKKMGSLGRYTKAIGSRGIGALAGLAIGATTAAVVGTGIAAGGTAAAYTASKRYQEKNKQFFNESPYATDYGYRTSRSISQSLNSSGDIVLGMHNSRRGY